MSKSRMKGARAQQREKAKLEPEKFKGEELDAMLDDPESRALIDQIVVTMRPLIALRRSTGYKAQPVPRPEGISAERWALIEAAVERLVEREARLPDPPFNVFNERPLPSNRLDRLDLMGNTEVRCHVELIVLATPWAVLRQLTVEDITPIHRWTVLEAAKAEANERGINLFDALEDLRQAVERQVATTPRDRLKYLGSVETYFRNRNYRLEPTRSTSKADARAIFGQSNSDVTRNWYAEMNQRGFEGQLAVALFRAQKSWDNVENWPMSRFSEQKNRHRRWALSEVCRILSEQTDFCRWGWGEDPATPQWPHVLSLELPRGGTITLYCELRLQGPDYQRFYPYTTAELERSYTRDRILDYCDRIQGLL
jgi:hypothetical protein